MRRWLLLLSLFQLSSLPGQNLVPNPGFERYHQCPPYPGQIHEAIAWDSPNNQTTDFFHRCADPADGAGVPQNLLGRQEPHSGDGYGGIRTWIPVIDGNPLYREYLSVRLTAPLQAGERYAVRFWVSVAEASSHLSDDLGLYFSATAFDQAARYAVTPQLRQPDGFILEDVEKWVSISGAYRAEGGEQYLLIGNFLDDADMTRQPVADREPVVYYYIDDVEVRPCSAPADLHRQIDTSLCSGASLLLRGAAGADDYRWNDGSRLTEKSVTGPGVYSVESHFPCYTLRTAFSVRFEDCACTLQWPVLHAGTASTLPLPPRADHVEFRLYDALGRLLKRQLVSDSIHLPALPAGAYFWQAEVMCRKESNEVTRQRRSGRLTVVH